jgi:hypothetical protein
VTPAPSEKEFLCASLQKAVLCESGTVASGDDQVIKEAGEPHSANAGTVKFRPVRIGAWNVNWRRELISRWRAKVTRNRSLIVSHE